MPWVRLDDNFPDHPKVVDAGPLAAWLYVCGVAYASRYLTDGYIPAGQVRKLADVDGAAALADRLVEVGLWERVDGGFQVHDFLEYNPSAEKVRAERSAAKERMQRVRSGDVRANTERTDDEPTDDVREKFNDPVPIPVPRTPVPETQAQPAPNGAQRARVREGKPPTEPVQREPNPTWDALAAAAGGPATKNERSDFGMTVSQLDEAGATPEQIADFPPWWYANHTVPLTHRCFRDHWGRYLTAPERPPQVSDIKNGRLKAALTTDLSDITAELEAQHAERKRVSRQVDTAWIPPDPRRIGTGGDRPLPHVLPADRSGST
jgi:hypothetical protein